MFIKLGVYGDDTHLYNQERICYYSCPKFRNRSKQKDLACIAIVVELSKQRLNTFSNICSTVEEAESWELVEIKRKITSVAATCFKPFSLTARFSVSFFTKVS